jgi:hypothetical protein
MGSFGRRCSGTAGWPSRKLTGVRPSRQIINYDRRGDDDYYCITPVLYQAITDTKIVAKS